MDNSTLINRGTGAGGANTNKNGLPYEEMTDLRDKYTVIEYRRLIVRFYYAYNIF